MYIVTNTVHVKEGFAEGFIERFNKEGKIEFMDGFLGLEVMLTDHKADYEEITISTRWETKDNFKGWMTSDAFKSAHAHRGGLPDFMIKNKTSMYEVKVVRQPMTVSK